MKKIVLFALFIAFVIPVTAQVASIGNETTNIKVFPNPATDYIELSDNDKVTQVLIFNLVGKEMKRFDAAAGQKYYISELPRGLYLVQLIDRSGQPITTQRVSKR
ncbi:MAG TPA: T9SS type A sorting domain-containing protein [Saprospiraceae bacterium]|nr:T9SS type A sorting domain-containing protein [Saprospiraceae bacterium]